MRGILFGLLLSNALYLAWGFMVERNQHNTQNSLPQFANTANENSLILVSEANPTDLLPYRSAASTATSQASLEGQSVIELEGGARGGLYCAEIGPFHSEADAAGFVETNAARFPMIAEVREVSAAPDYRVFLPPFASRELAVSTMGALRAAFTENKLIIDSFLVPRGELANSIALGLFTERANALNVQSQLQKLGYTVVVRTEERTREEVWVVVSGVESEAVFMQHWSEIQLSRSYIHTGERFC